MLSGAFLLRFTIYDSPVCFMFGLGFEVAIGL
jgi:hypothetical protein